jgi:NAD(P)-dependent dehydrogenase (short-subunit alcohol dehydrogenase family)
MSTTMFEPTAESTRTAVVTGASQGFGLAFTRALSATGWTVVVDARHENTLREATSGLPGVVAVAGDITGPAHRRALVDAAQASGGVDLLVNNASYLGRLGPLGRASLDDLSAVYAADVLAPLALTQLTIPLLERAIAPTVVMLSSDAAAEAYPGWGGYGSAKAALDHVAATFAVENPWLRVYAFDPGDMRTAMQQEAFPGEDISDRQDPCSVVPALLRLLVERPPSGRYRASELVEVAR